MERIQKPQSPEPSSPSTGSVCAAANVERQPPQQARPLAATAAKMHAARATFLKPQVPTVHNRVNVESVGRELDARLATIFHKVLVVQPIDHDPELPLEIEVSVVRKTRIGQTPDDAKPNDTKPDKRKPDEIEPEQDKIKRRKVGPEHGVQEGFMPEMVPFVSGDLVSLTTPGHAKNSAFGSVLKSKHAGKVRVLFCNPGGGFSRGVSFRASRAGALACQAGRHCLDRTRRVS